MTSAPANPLQEFSEAWASIYPLLHWGLEHPIGSLCLALGSLYLVWGLFRGLIYLTETLWLRLLRAPLSLARYLWQQFRGKKSKSATLNTGELLGNTTPNYQRLNDLIDQLEAGHQRQEQLLHMAKSELERINSGSNSKDA